MVALNIYERDIPRLRRSKRVRPRGRHRKCPDARDSSAGRGDVYSFGPAVFAVRFGRPTVVELGWISSAELPQAAGAALETLPINEVSSPISTRDGVYILLVEDRRRFAAVDPEQVTVTLKQIFIPLKANADDDSIGSQMALARTDRCYRPRLRGLRCLGPRNGIR